ncbi:MAG: alpha/beta hydrolase [Alphaproteobacteria bacterium]|nr:alpha/beta hydrolase [Alphaproteobacteria bacterium]
MIRKQYIEGRYGQVHVRLVRPPAEKTRPLVCFHQSPLSGRMYETFMTAIGDDRRVVAPDTVGFGESAAAPRSLTIADYAEAHGDAIDALIQGEFDVLGTHTGARMAVEVALQRPDQVRHVVLIGCAVYTEEERARQRAWTGASAQPTEGSDGSHLLRLWHNWAQFRGPGVTDAMIDRYMADSLRRRDQVSDVMKAVFSHDMTRVGLVRCPVLVFNVRDDIYEATKRAEPLLQRGRVVDMSPSGLWLTETRTAEVVAMIRDHLSR